jgi:effector-binding domain-containing protein
MSKLITSVLIALSPFVLCSCTVGIEKPSYTVIEKEGPFEIRQYPPQLVAETVVDAEFEEAGDAAFGRLFKYISGNNQGKKSIAMTAPVTQTDTSEKIAMTAPVTQQQTEGNYAVSFVMPSKYTLETLPQPLDERVVIKEIPAQKMAVIRYSGTWSQKRYEEKKAALEGFIRKRGLRLPVNRSGHVIILRLSFGS